MASRIASRFSRISLNTFKGSANRYRGISTHPSTGKNNLLQNALLAVAVGGGSIGGLYYLKNTKKSLPIPAVLAATSNTKIAQESPVPAAGVKPPRGASVIPEPLATPTGAPCRARKQSDEGKPVQPNIISPLKEHSLFLWIKLNPCANPCNTIKAAANLQCLADELNDCRCPEDNIIAGVGFGPNFWSQVMGKTCKNFAYTHRKGRNGEMPSTPGDIFVHAKCDSKGKLFELCQNFLRSLPPDSIEDFEDIYSFNYQDGRDLSGFIVNQINPTDKNAKKDVAVECETGGSYCLTQVWNHDFCTIEEAGCKKLECYVGRGMECGEDNCQKPLSSHVARMNGGQEYQDPPPFEIVRQSQPYGSLCKDAGIFYCAFANDTKNFEFLLDRMIGASCDGGHDDIMKISANVKGAYWYFPGVCELQQLKGCSGNN